MGDDGIARVVIVLDVWCFRGGTPQVLQVPIGNGIGSIAPVPWCGQIAIQALL